MKRSWSDGIRQASLALHSGLRVPEIVWEERAGLAAGADAAGRNPEPLERCLCDAQGRRPGTHPETGRSVGGVLCLDG